MKVNFYTKSKILFLKFVLAISFIAITQLTLAQIVFTICQGDEVVLSGFITPNPPGQSGPPPYPCAALIEPLGSIVGSDQNSFTVAPIFTTTYTVSSNCIPSTVVLGQFTVVVEECESIVCNTNDPFVNLPWLDELINREDANGFGYYNYINLYDLEDESYIEVISELDNGRSQIYTCNGSLFCERQDSFSCTQFNESNLNNTIYNTTCTPTADEANPSDNKIDLHVAGVINPFSLYREEHKSIIIRLGNNGPCYLYEVDLIIEVNGAIIGTEHWTGAIEPRQYITVDTELKYRFEPGIDYEVRIWSANPNGSSDLNFANDTTTRFYKGFEPEYDFEIQKFVTPVPITSDGMHPVSIHLENRSNTKQAEAIYIYWWVNGEEQEPLIVEDYPYNIEEVTFQSQPYRSDTIVLGNHFFEKDKDYLIEAMVDLPPELRDPNEPQDKLSYFLEAISAQLDLRIHDIITPTLQTFGEDGIISLNIHKIGTIPVDEFKIKWFINNEEQTSFEIKNPDWSSLTPNSTTYENTIVTIDSIGFDVNTNYEFRFTIETPENYNESDLGNNDLTFSYQPDNNYLYQADVLLEVCKKDSIQLIFNEYSKEHYPNYGGIVGPGFPVPCGTCAVTFNEPKWTVNGELIDTTLSPTVKPLTNTLYNFTCNVRETCTGCNTTDEAKEFENVSIGVVLVDCEKPTLVSNSCENYIGRALPGGDDNGNQIRIRYNSMILVDSNTNGQPLNLKSQFVKFDFESSGPKVIELLPKTVRRTYQEVTITCLEGIEPIDREQSYEYEICAGDQIEEALLIPSGLSSNFDEVICSNLLNNSEDDVSIDSYFSDDCNIVFDVKDRIIDEQITYISKLQTVDYNTPIIFEWEFDFTYKDDCESISNPIFNTYPWLTDFVDPTDCAGKTAYVYDADGYEFLVLKTNLAELLMNSEGKVYCISPAGGFSFVEMYDESRIIDSWACDEEFQGKLGTTKVQNQGIQIFPNPANDKVFVNLQKLTFKQPVIAIYDVQGKEVLQTSSIDAFAGIVQLDVRDLANGIYLVEVQTSNTIITEKLLIK